MTEKTESTALIPVQLQVNVTPAKIDTNIEPLRLALIEKIDNQSKTVITLENLQEGKNLAAEINKTKKLISDERKRVAGEAGLEVKAFEDQMKALEKICTDGYDLLKRQTDEFDLAKKAEHLQIIKDALAAAWEAAGVEPEFRRATVDDLASLTAVTPKGSLTKATKTTLDSRVAEDKSLQDRTNMRLVLLENQSLKAGLVAPLDRNHVAAFLFAPDDVYQSRLDLIIQSEIQRQHAAQERARNDQIAEQARLAAQEQANRQAVQQVEVSPATDQAAPIKNNPAQQEYTNHQGIFSGTSGQNLGLMRESRQPSYVAEPLDKFVVVLAGAQQGKAETCTATEFEQRVIAMSLNEDGYFEIHSKNGGFVAIARNGELFRKVTQ